MPRMFVVALALIHLLRWMMIFRHWNLFWHVMVPVVIFHFFGLCGKGKPFIDQ